MSEGDGYLLERALSQWFKLKEREDCSKLEKIKKNPHFEEIAKELTGGQGKWQSIRTISHAYINRGDLTEIGKAWFYFINSVLKASMHVSTMRQDRVILLYALVKGYQVDLGRIVEESILECAKGNFAGNIPHPSLITLLCINGGVKFNGEEEERCPNTSPLNLTGVLKAPMESEEGERREKRTKKIKRAKTKTERGVSPVRDQAPIAVSDEGDSSKEMGGFKSELEQPMLSPVVDNGVSTQTRAGREEKRVTMRKAPV